MKLDVISMNSLARTVPWLNDIAEDNLIWRGTNSIWSRGRKACLVDCFDSGRGPANYYERTLDMEVFMSVILPCQKRC